MRRLLGFRGEGFGLWWGGFGLSWGGFGLSWGIVRRVSGGGVRGEGFGFSWGGLRAFVGRFRDLVGRILGYRGKISAFVGGGGVRAFVGGFRLPWGHGASGFLGEGYGLSWAGLRAFVGRVKRQPFSTKFNQTQLRAEASQRDCVLGQPHERRS